MTEPVEAGGRLGHYLLLEKIGAGGMGEVYRARDTKLERSVAIKVLPALAAGDRNAVERLVREARLASSLNHPGIVTIHGIEDSGDLPYLVMELVPGETLRARLRRGPLELSELVSIGSQVADALDAAHRVGLIHRDIKSTNILVTPDGRAKVADFGLAKRVPTASDDPEVTAGVSLTATGAVVGTAAYMSPEQTRGEELDARTDVFSLGVVLYEAATGRLPFEGPTVLSVLHEIALVEPPAPSRARAGVPRELDQVLRRAMAKDKGRRYGAAGELAAALRALLKATGSDPEEETAILVPTTEGGGDAPGSAPGRPRTAFPTIPNNLPVSLTSFVGRREEMDEIGVLLASSRLVTLTGAGGCGKSRLATQVARNVLEGYADGAWLVELAPLTDPALVVSRAAQTLGIRETPGHPLLESICGAMAGRSFLLVLDNCEHVTAACGSLAAALVATCPGGRILATSRETLGVPGEVIVRVAPLGVPDIRDPKQLVRREVGRFESVRLFAERAASVVPSFTLTEQNAAIAAQICARLDGIPLAIELAAARIRVLPIGQILGRLEDRFRLLTAGSPGALPHQQTLRAAVDWSYDLLDEPERTLFCRLSVFAGGASLEAVEAVASGDGLGSDAILDLLTHLVDKSLVTPEEGAAGTARYRLLETLREYGKGKLAESGAQSRFLERHASHFVGLAEEASGELTGRDQSRWLEALEEDHDNLRRAMDWGMEGAQGDGAEARATALRLAAALWRFWLVRGHFSEGRRRLTAALSITTERDNARVRAKALRGAAVLARAQSDYERARGLIEESLTLERAENDRAGIAESLQELGNIADGQGDHTRARTHYEESLAIRRDLGDRRGMAGLLHNLGVVTQAQGDLVRARALYTESLAINRELGNEAWEAAALNALASVAFEQEDYVAARLHQEQSLVIHRRLRDKWGIAYTLHELGRVATRTGDLGNARRMLEDALRIFRDLGDSVGVAETLEYFAALAAVERRDELALLLAGSAAALREELGTPPTATDLAGLETHLAGPRERLGKEAAAALLARGRARNAEEVIAEVIDMT